MNGRTNQECVSPMTNNDIARWVTVTLGDHRMDAAVHEERVRIPVVHDDHQHLADRTSVRLYRKIHDIVNVWMVWFGESLFVEQLSASTGLKHGMRLCD